MHIFGKVSATALALCLATPSAANDEKSREIVVTGISLKDSEAALRNCIATKCPPDQDMRASLTHAENQFVAGEYRLARTTLRQSVGRNRQHRSTHPVDLSNVYRASGRVSEHLGIANEYRLSLLDMRDTLAKALPADDPQTLNAQIEVADSRVKLGFFDNALELYDNAEKTAAASGQHRIASFAKIRALTLKYLLAYENGYGPDKRNAVAELRQLVASPAPGAEDIKLIGEVMLARIDRKEGRTDSTDAIIARFASEGTTKPLLLHAEPVEVPESAYGARTHTGQYAPRNGGRLPAAQNVLTQLGRNFEDRWLDVGFWVNADGKTGDIEILRSSGGTGWADAVTKSIATRIYAPLKGEEGKAPPSFFMVERYTYTARYLQDLTGTRIPKRSTQGRIERLDLTPYTVTVAQLK